MTLNLKRRSKSPSAKARGKKPLQQFCYLSFPSVISLCLSLCLSLSLSLALSLSCLGLQVVRYGISTQTKNPPHCLTRLEEYWNVNSDLCSGHSAGRRWRDTRSCRKYSQTRTTTRRAESSWRRWVCVCHVGMQYTLHYKKRHNKQDVSFKALWVVGTRETLKPVFYLMDFFWSSDWMTAQAEAGESVSCAAD